MFFTAGIIIFTLIRIIFQKKIYSWPIKYLQYVLPIISFGFYGQIFLLFTTAFYCRKEESPTSPYLQCRDTWFNNFKFMVGIAMVLHFIIAFITNTLYYHPTFIKCKTDLLQKTNSFPDVVFLCRKSPKNCANHGKIRRFRPMIKVMFVCHGSRAKTHLLECRNAANARLV